MSAKTETLVVPAKPVATYVVVVLVALVIGASLGSLITNAVISDASPTVETAPGILPWDPQKLDAIAGLQAAAAAQAESAGIRPWDEQMLEQMQGRQLAATYRADGPGIQPWDDQKLEAMALRALAAARS
jgi:hypothetical protein